MVLTSWLAIVGDDPGGATTSLFGGRGRSTTVQGLVGVMETIGEGRAHQTRRGGEEQRTLHAFQESANVL